MANIDRYKIESDESWREWASKVPAITFDAGWLVKVIPPFAGAMARFIVEHNEKKASVYLDVNDSLGYMQKPYWEVYPVDGDTGRCSMGDTDELLALIRRAIDA